MSLPNSLKHIRQKLFLTQDDFASQINVSVATINRWENGRSRPNMTAMKNIKAFCEQNNIPFEQLESEWLKEG